MLCGVFFDGLNVMEDREEVDRALWCRGDKDSILAKLCGHKVYVARRA